MRSLAERTAQPYVLLVVIAWDCFAAFMYGRLEEALDITQRIRARAVGLRLVEFGSLVAATGGLRPQIYLGRVGQALESGVLSDSTLSGSKLLCLAYAGQRLR